MASYGAILTVDPTKESLSLRTLVSTDMINLFHLTKTLTNLYLFLLIQIDHSIVESFGGLGKVCISARVYPTKAIEDKAHLYAFNNGKEDITISTLSAWSMKKAQIN